MPIPDYESIMLPLLQFISDGKTYGKQDVVAAMARHYKLTDDELSELVKSGTPLFGGRVHWAIQYMLNAKLVERPARAQVRITPRGLELVKDNPEELNTKILRKYPEFVAWQGKARERTKTETSDASDHTSDTQLTPDEQIERGYTEIRDSLAEELLEKVKSGSPRFFEKLVVELLVRMGYGCSLTRPGEVVGKSGDGGIDGFIKEDKLGLDVVYIQAKRWEGAVGRPVVQAFAGSLEGVRARKGVLITTSSFTAEAEEYVTRIEKRIVLVNGSTLAQLMIDHDIGVSTVTTYTIKRLDSDYFEE